MIKVKIIVIVKATERGFFESVSLVIGENTRRRRRNRRGQKERKKAIVVYLIK